MCNTDWGYKAWCSADVNKLGKACFAHIVFVGRRRKCRYTIGALL